MSENNPQTPPTKPKRGGNPNWVKGYKRPVPTPKVVDPAAQVSPMVAQPLINLPPSISQFGEIHETPSKQTVWLQCFCALIGAYGTVSSGVLRQAATLADLAVTEYESRF